jgi:regulatory factor X 1/2/3
MALRQASIGPGKRFKAIGHAGNGDGEDHSQQQQHLQFLGSASSAMPNFGTIEVGAEPLPEGITHDNIKSFEILYTEHCEVNTWISVMDFYLKE